MLGAAHTASAISAMFDPNQTLAKPVGFWLEQDWEEGDGKYVAPELLNGRIEPTPAADVYSLGATLYECATGETLTTWLCLRLYK